MNINPDEQTLESIIQAPLVPAIETLPSPNKVAEEISQYEKPLDYEKSIDELTILSLKNDIELRKIFARRLFASTWIWLFIVLIMIVCAGMGKLHLSDKVLIALLGAGSVNVISMLIIVCKYLFHHPDAKETSRIKKLSD